MSNKKQKSVGRPSVIEDKAKREIFIKIWIDKMYCKLPVWEILEKYDVSKSTYKRAITFVNKEFINIPNKELLKGAIFAIEERIKNLTIKLKIELERKNEPSVRSMVELNREIREDSRDLMKLQNLYKEYHELELGDSTREILEILAKKK